MKKTLAAVFGLMLVVLGGCATVPDDPSLFGRMGGGPVLSAVVNDYFANMAADDRLKARLAKTDTLRLKDIWIDRLCAVSSGPCTYETKDMPAAYKGTRLTYGEFNAMIEDLTAALTKNNVSPALQGELLPLVYPLSTDVVDQ